MLRGDLGQKRNPLLVAIITAVSFFIGLSLVKYLWRGQFDLIESLIGALVFFVVYYFLGSYLNKKIERKKQKREEKNRDQKQKIIIILLAIVILLTGIWFSLDFHTKNSLYRATLCKLIYGKNICNFYAMMDTQNPSISDFDNMMSLCQEMSDVPKKDSCFEYVAEVFARIDAEKAQQACNEIKEFNSVHDKEICHSKISKIQEINESKKEAIKIYLEENIWKPYNKGKVFCAYEVLGERVANVDDLIPEGAHPVISEYLWVLCEEYYLENGKLREGGGTSLPVALALQRENHIYKVISHEVPGSGSYYGKDIKRIFPKDIQNKIFSSIFNNHNQRVKILGDEIKKEAEFYFNNPCAVCINGCDTCPEGCEECLIGIEKKLKDPNMKWYYNPDIVK